VLAFFRKKSSQNCPWKKNRRFSTSLAEKDFCHYVVFFKKKRYICKQNNK